MQPGSVVSSRMQSPKLVKTFLMCDSGGLRERWSIHAHCRPFLRHTQRWKCFWATLIQCKKKKKKHKECTKAYNKRSSPSMEAICSFFALIFTIMWQKCQAPENAVTLDLFYRNWLSVLQVNFPHFFLYLSVQWWYVFICICVLFSNLCLSLVTIMFLRIFSSSFLYLR